MLVSIRICFPFFFFISRRYQQTGLEAFCIWVVHHVVLVNMTSQERFEGFSSNFAQMSRLDFNFKFNAAIVNSRESRECIERFLSELTLGFRRELVRFLQVSGH